MTLPDFLRRMLAAPRRWTHRKVRHINRLSRKSVQMGLLLGGAGLVALMSLGFAYLADKAAHWGEQPLHVWLRSVVKDDASFAHIEEMLGVGTRPS